MTYDQMTAKVDVNLDYAKAHIFDLCSSFLNGRCECPMFCPFRKKDGSTCIKKQIEEWEHNWTLVKDTVASIRPDFKTLHFGEAVKK